MIFWTTFGRTWTTRLHVSNRLLPNHRRRNRNVPSLRLRFILHKFNNRLAIPFSSRCHLNLFKLTDNQLLTHVSSNRSRSQRRHTQRPLNRYSRLQFVKWHQFVKQHRRVASIASYCSTQRRHDR
ncbi:MAG: hypothetical protein ACI93T_003885 [Porticoccaceae bacterium]